MSEAQPVYSVDTSALIDGLERYYPAEAFPALWERVDGLIDEGRFLVSEEVWEEVKTKDAVVKAWCEPRKDRLLVPTDASTTTAVTELLVDHERLVMNLKGRNRADPFVIALAQIKGAIVLTGEGFDGTANRPKIPYVCAQVGVGCHRFLEMIRLEGWRF
ncbi:MAG TPA: DUF4411 family protein [Acidimicrobiales bacterium]|nr:DUF4411 family protein [Acidimicrobiales bacterium]